MKNTSNTIRTICEIGIFAALGFVFDELQGILFKGIFVNGGSIGFAMIAVLIVAYRRGFLPAFLTGLLMGIFDIATSAYILNPMQMLLDYIFPYAFVGLAGLLKPMFDKYDDKKCRILWLIAGAFVGGIAKFLSHYFAGIFFWTDPATFAWDMNSMNVYLYCFIYNIAFIGPSIIICAALLVLIYMTAPKVLTNKNTNLRESDNSNALQAVASGIVTAGGAFVFVYYLIKYIKSFSSYKDGGAFGYDFDPDCMLIMLLGLFLVVLGVITLIKYFKKNYSYVLLTGGLSAISLSSLVYCTARFIRMIVKNKAWDAYLVWFIVAVAIFAVTLGCFFEALDASKNKAQIEETK